VYLIMGGVVFTCVVFSFFFFIQSGVLHCMLFRDVPVLWELPAALYPKWGSIGSAVALRTGQGQRSEVGS
jgi:hypothetical protein